MRLMRAGLLCGTSLLIDLGLPLLGWGAGDLAGFLSQGARLRYALGTAGFALAVAVQATQGDEGIRGGAGDGDKLVRRQTVVRFAMSLCLFGALFLLPFADRRGLGVISLGQAARWSGAGLCGLGYLLVFWSGLALGKQYSPEVTIQKDHWLIGGGPYRVIRHPRHLEVPLLGLGAGLVFRSWAGLLGCLPLAAILLSRIHDEEALLRREFGPAWDAYCARRWRLAPHIH